MAVTRGTLLSPTVAPEIGERIAEIVRFAGVTVEQILSAALSEPVDYDQAHDEWVVVLEGAAVVVIDDEAFEIGRGDWVFLPAHTPHRLLKTAPGTSWLALHATG